MLAPLLGARLVGSCSARVCLVGERVLVAGPAGDVGVAGRGRWRHVSRRWGHSRRPVGRVAVKVHGLQGAAAATGGPSQSLVVAVFRSRHAFSRLWCACFADDTTQRQPSSGRVSVWSAACALRSDGCGHCGADYMAVTSGLCGSGRVECGTSWLPPCLPVDLCVLALSLSVCCGAVVVLRLRSFRVVSLVFTGAASLACSCVFSLPLPFLLAMRLPRAQHKGASNRGFDVSGSRVASRWPLGDDAAGRWKLATRRGLVQ